MKSIKSLLFFIVLLAFDLKGMHCIDSLESLLKIELPDKNRADILNELSKKYLLLEKEKSLRYSKKAYFLSVNIAYTIGEAEALNNIGEVHLMKGEFEKAFDFFMAAQKVFFTANLTSGTGTALNNMARALALQGKFDYAIHLSFMAIRFFQISDDKLGIAKAFNTIGFAFDKNNQNSKALQYYQKSFNLLYNIKDTIAMVNSLNNLAIAFGKRGDLKKSLNLFKQVLELSRKMNILRLKAPALNNIGNIHKSNKNYVEAEQYYKESMQNSIKYNNLRDLIFSYMNLSSLYYDLNRLNEALYYADLSTQLALNLNAKTELVDSYENLSRIYEKKGNYVKSLKYYKKFNAKSNEIQNEKVLSNMKLSEKKFYLENKQKELELQLKDNEILHLELNTSKWFRNFILGVLISVIALFVMLLHQYLSKKKTNENLSRLNIELSDTNIRLIESEKKLRDLNATKDKFFSIISHDLRNPIASIVSFARIINRDYDSMSETEIKEFIADMKETTEKAQDLLENLLLWSKTQSGKFFFKPEVFNFYDLIQENILLFQSAISQKQISIQIFSENPIMMFADYNMIKTVVRNLMSNSIKFTHQRGNVRISTESTEKYFIFKFEDDGVGIKHHEIPLLFIPGEQKNKNGTANEKGTGIGLLLSKEFIDRHKGHFQIKSEIGKGSTFAVYIPKYIY